VFEVSEYKKIEKKQKSRIKITDDVHIVLNTTIFMLIPEFREIRRARMQSE